MMKIANFSVGTRLAMSFGILLVLLVILSGAGLRSLSLLNDESRQTLDDRYPKILAVNMVIAKVHGIASAMRNMFVHSYKDEIDKELELNEVAKSVIQTKIAYLEKATVTKQGLKLVMTMKAAYAKYLTPQEQFTKKMAAGRSEEAKNILLYDLTPKQTELMAALDELARYQTALMEKSGRDSKAEFDAGLLIMSVMTVAAILIGILVSWLITRSITHPLKQAMTVAQQVASGDLNTSAAVTTHDEAGRLLQALEIMTTSLRSIVGNVRSGADTIATASSEIAAGNLDLSSRTEQQASSLQETASAMDSLTSTVQQNADHAREANDLAIAAADVARHGFAMVKQMVSTMGEIQSASHKIADIISVIDGITFQTNILALNAAVEAARAGEAGRGFAVVAAEVRNLAQRSAAAAKEIKVLINNSVEIVNTGTTIAGKTGGTMIEIVDRIHKVTVIMADITAASRQQHEGIVQVNQAIGLMDQTTQQNAAIVEEAAAAAQSLQDQASALVDAVAVFAWKDGHESDPVPVLMQTHAQPSVPRIDRTAQLASPKKVV
ncbi:MAG: MCP four helix bundle domain-containing protein [Herminiimonas sp.]|nr:MCP four helix bundle domain-containing protein [Herminiimonas sp.]